MMFLNRPSKLASFFEVSRVPLNTSRYMLREFSYMVLITDSADMTKKRMEPRFATGAYLTRVNSISFAVTWAFWRFSAMFFALVLVFSSVLISSWLSRMLPSAELSSLSNVSSSCLSSIELSAISLTSSSRCSSRSGRSCRTVTLRSCSCRPCSVTE